MTAVTGRFDSFVYDDGTLYGEDDTTGLLIWSVEIDWNQDGVFDGSNEASRMFSITRSRGRKKMLKQPSQQGSKQVSIGFESVPPGRCTIKLRNNDGRYDGWNESSPLYPYVTYGPDVKIRVASQSDEVWRSYFYGTIVDIRPFGYSGDAYVEIEIEDGGRHLRSYTARSPINQGITPSQAIDYILDAVSWPTRWGRNIDASTGVINYHYASGNKLASSELEDVANSFLGYFFIAANGNARYVDRNTEQSSVIDFTQSVLLKDVSFPQPIVNRRNITRIKVGSLKAAATGVIYQVNGDPLLVEAGSQIIRWANYTYNNVSVPAMNVVQPVGTTDYLCFANSDGTGANLTTDCSFVVTDFGDNAKMVISNNGATNFYVTFRQIRGDALYEENVSDVTYPEDITTVKTPREFVLEQRWQQSLNVAADYAAILGPFLDDKHPFPVVKMQGRPDMQFIPDLFDLCVLDVNEKGIVGEPFRIGGIEDKSLGETCQHVESKFYLEPYLSVGTAWTWPITNFGVDTVFGAG